MAVVKLYKPMSYQKPIIEALENDNYKYVTACLSRRIGKSLTAKNMLLKWALESRCSIGYVTPTSGLSRKFIKEIVGNLSATSIIKSSNNVDMFIEFINGSIVYFMSAESKDSNRGSGFKYLIYDEASYIAHATYLSIFKPMELQAEKVFSISTPSGQSGFFYDYFSLGNSAQFRYRRYISFLTTLEDSKLYDEQTISEIKEASTRMVYSQEYNCEFVSGGISCFGDLNKRLQKKRASRDRLFAGIDFSGDGTDETVLTIVNEKYETVLVKTYAIGNSKSISDMAKTMNKMNVEYCIAEKNSMGSISIDYLKKSFKNVKGITTTNESKREYVELVVLNFEKSIGTIEDEPATLKQFNAFVMKRTATGKISYSNINDAIHDDRVISYCLASLAVKKKTIKGVYNIK